MKGDITPERWVGYASKKFPPSQNPWSEIYTNDAAVEIAKTIRLESPAQIEELRLQLAATAEYLLSVFDFVGGSATPAQKLAWAAKIDDLSRRLMAGLADSDDLLSSVVVRIGKEKSSRFVPASEMRKRVKQTEATVSNLLELVQAVSGAPKDVGAATAHAETMQAVVNGITEVFIDIRGLEHVKRSASEGKIDGEYPEFIREAARPLLAAYYSKFSKDSTNLENLNRQIQRAVSDYRFDD
ncbi:hypothetical protein NBRC116594_15600 [Shimia sp. NS0008-38b]|uniref:hypothetical protein n=1 Tax=Shimia sp. NS0008-38b TaxID=3127653 RepID=UPI00310C10D6